MKGSVRAGIKFDITSKKKLAKLCWTFSYEKNSYFHRLSEEVT